MKHYGFFLSQKKADDIKLYGYQGEIHTISPPNGNMWV